MTPPPKHRSGFTLIELLVVIAIAMLLMTFSITAYFGAIKSTATSKARGHLRDVLTQTRQRACLEGVSYGVYCFSTKDKNAAGKNVDIPAYVIVRLLGTYQVDGSNYLWDLFGSLAEQFTKTEDTSTATVKDKVETAQIFNLINGKSGTIELFPKNFMAASEDSPLKEIPRSGFSMKYPGGKVDVPGSDGSIYGVRTKCDVENNGQVDLAVRASIDYFFPSGYEYTNVDSSDSTNKKLKILIFYPDGSGNKESVSLRQLGTNGDTFTATVSKDGKITIN